MVKSEVVIADVNYTKPITIIIRRWELQLQLLINTFKNTITITITSRNYN